MNFLAMSLLCIYCFESENQLLTGYSKKNSIKKRIYYFLEIGIFHENLCAKYKLNTKEA